MMADQWCMVCRESSSSEIEISMSNEIKTSPKLTSQCMPLSGLGFHSIQLQKRTKNASKLAF